MKPEWLRIRPPSGEEYEKVKSALARNGIRTVCQSSHCPNVSHCWSKRAATFLILGDTCTRNCRFCAVKKGKPASPDREEPKRLASAISELGLDYVILTSVDRDDLPDGGARHYADCIRAVKSANRFATVETLIPDFSGKKERISEIVSAGPNVVSHNLETVHRLQPLVRDRRASYERSLSVLETVKNLSPKTITKTSLLLGMGEDREEVHRAIVDIRGAGVDILVLGQYLAPSPAHFPVAEYLPPEKFDYYRITAENMGLACVAEPFARTSYKAAELYGRIS